ncbi:MAG TPA: hypothetical protein VK154_09265 [Chitinophagales bacterium]|nr:hypothetical protein [Chitinophagales bacterium]
MKKTFFALLTFVAAAAFAQEVQTPEFKNTPMYLKADGSLDKLEKQTAAIKDKGGSNPWANAYGGGANKTVQYINCTGASSSVVLPTTATFIVKLKDAETDPDGTFVLTEAVVVKGMREVYIRKDYGRNVQEKQVTLQYQKVSPGVYKVIPDHLNPGTEYCFVTNNDDANKVVNLFKTEGTAPKGKK